LDGRPVLAQTCDVTERESVQALVARVVRELGPIDVLVNNAGIIEVGPFEDTTLTDFGRAMNITFWGALHFIMEAYPSMIVRRAGAIVNITSIGGWVSVPHLLP